ncbi:STAM-binding protein-like [Coccinella septempunctata]|uniref:STAM-binding protein-like n=1 Tax=Coccinella septempunctata TaxID=41139 RepID=UPI001D0728D9|nr:STAM-binding protein-like [Coccinella septempunctata]
MDWSVTALNTNDLLPKKRLENLYDKAKFTHVVDGVDVHRYSDIATQLLNSANRLKREKNWEDSLLNFLRYQILVKKLKSHVRYSDLHLGRRAAFDYRLKEVAKNIRALTEKVSSGYKKVYELTDFNMDSFLGEGYQERRPTVSTVRTFVSTPRASGVSVQHQPHKRSISPSRDRSKSFSKQRISAAVCIPIIKSSSSLNSDLGYGLRRSIFPMRQVREFDEIHKQRRTVRGHRTVVIPSRITTAFSYLSLQNNKKNVETVGYLAGRESEPNVLVITHLLLPKQQGYSDYFKVIDSSSLVRYLDAEDLMTIGWIHSHPMETPYLSSSDMHYHGVFQNVLPEAIAIVYSPKEMRSQVFNLTPDHGLTTIMACGKKGFHTHPSKPPITMVSHHTVNDLFGDLTVKDFRSEKSSVTFLPESGKIRRRSEGSGHLAMERLLQVKTSTGALSPVRIRRSEVNFVHLDARIEGFKI